MSIFARINRLQYVTRFYGRNTFLFHPKIQTRPIETIAMPISISKLRTCLSARYTRRRSKKKKKNTFHKKKVRTKLQQVFEREKRIELKIDEILTLSPRCIPTFAAGPSGRVHITYANVRPSVPVLPPTTLRPKPAAVKLNNLSIYNTR